MTVRKVAEVGEMVTISIPDPESWNLGAYNVLDGKRGKVFEILLAERMTGHPFKVPRVLVEFDPPLPPTWSNGSPISAHWFDATEVGP